MQSGEGGLQIRVLLDTLCCFECNKPQWTIAYFDPKWLIINCHFNYTMARVVACPEVCGWGAGVVLPLSNPFCERERECFHLLFDFFASLLKHARKIEIRVSAVRLPAPRPLGSSPVTPFGNIFINI